MRATDAMLTASTTPVLPNPARPAEASLAAVLAYENDALIHKFLERFDMPFEEAEALFCETKKWLWLASRPTRPAQLAVREELMILDEMWHTFILFTVDYAAFCSAHFGRFVHHAPTRHDDKAAFERESAADPEAARARSHEQMREELVFIAQELGAPTVHRWFIEFPQRYGAEFFARAQRTVSLPARPEHLAALALVDRGYHQAHA